MQEPDDGRVLPCPTNDPSIILQRQIIGDMRRHGAGTYVMQDPWDRERPMTYGQVFVEQARAMMVITEVEQRAQFVGVL